ncbi:MAG: hypothetical protein JNL90_04240 [Planctomycetes bacterium]|nr:hypothetical protein [Planctomycetota bacterium]
MDVTNLVPNQPPTRSEGAEARTRALGLPPGPTARADQAARAAASARPATATNSVHDRIERSGELEQRLAELKGELGRRPELRKDEIEAMQSELKESRHASHETLVRAALGILHGELFFLPN